MPIHKPLHPGVIVSEILLGEDSPYNSVADAAHALNVHRVTLSRLLNKHSDISNEMAARLALLTGTSVKMWLGLQCDYNIAQTEKMLKHIKVKKAA
jgi:antitoxin HigA-1